MPGGERPLATGEKKSKNRINYFLLSGSPEDFFADRLPVLFLSDDERL